MRRGSFPVRRGVQAASLVIMGLLFSEGPARYACASLGAIFLVASGVAELRRLSPEQGMSTRYRRLRFAVLMALTLYAVVYMFLAVGEGGLRGERLLLLGLGLLWAGDGLLSWARPRRLRSLIVHVSLALVTLFVLELCAAVYNSRAKIDSLYSHQLVGRNGVGAYDPWLGVPVAKMEKEPFFLWLSELGAIFYPDRKEGAVRTNELGMRDVKAVRPKEPGEIRILCLGASTTAQGIDTERTYPAYLERELNGAGGPVKFTVWNGAVPGWTMKTSLLHYIARYDVLEPDIIIVYHGINDLRIACKPAWAYYPLSEALFNPPPLAELAKGVLKSSELGKLLLPRLKGSSPGEKGGPFARESRGGASPSSSNSSGRQPASSPRPHGRGERSSSSSASTRRWGGAGTTRTPSGRSSGGMPMHGREAGTKSSSCYRR